MNIAQIAIQNGHQVLCLPPEFALNSEIVSMRKRGDTLILEPIKASEWPTDFFASILISDSNFTRPNQQELPAIQTLD